MPLPKINSSLSCIIKLFEPDVLPTVKTALNVGVLGMLSSTYFFVAKFKSAVGAIPVTKPVNVFTPVIVCAVSIVTASVIP